MNKRYRYNILRFRFLNMKCGVTIVITIRSKRVKMSKVHYNNKISIISHDAKTHKWYTCATKREKSVITRPIHPTVYNIRLYRSNKMFLETRQALFTHPFIGRMACVRACKLSEEAFGFILLSIRI